MGYERGHRFRIRRNLCRVTSNGALCAHIPKGIRELQSVQPLPSSRQRRYGGGRKPLEYHQPSLLKAIDRLVEPTERRDPQSPLRWTCMSLSNLQNELRRQGFEVGRTKIGTILHSLGYSLQGNRKTQEGMIILTAMHSSKHIARRVRACQRGGRLAISVNTKKKEVLGKQGKCWKRVSPQR